MKLEAVNQRQGEFLRFFRHFPSHVDVNSIHCSLSDFSIFRCLCSRCRERIDDNSQDASWEVELASCWNAICICTG